MISLLSTRSPHSALEPRFSRSSKRIVKLNWDSYKFFKLLFMMKTGHLTIPCICKYPNQLVRRLWARLWVVRPNCSRLTRIKTIYRLTLVKYDLYLYGVGHTKIINPSLLRLSQYDDQHSLILLKLSEPALLLKFSVSQWLWVISCFPTRLDPFTELVPKTTSSLITAITGRAFFSWLQLLINIGTLKLKNLPANNCSFRLFQLLCRL